MNYKVLYRKYRPFNFENLVGQDPIKTILKNSIINNKIAHAYIFSGPRGTGKTSTAKIFAKAINCLNTKNGEACEKCINCENFLTNTDIIEIDAASNNGVDQIREITNNVKLAPTMSKYKVYIIDEVHMLSQSAFNALLLTLEDPPQHVIFILATTNIESVPITILSRCQRFDFKKISNEDIIKRLEYVCKEEKIAVGPGVLDEIAYISDGGMRDALSVLDQLSKDGKELTLDMVIKEVGSVSLKSIEKILDYIESSDSTSLLKQINEYRSSALDYKLIIKKIIDVAAKRAKNIVLTGKAKRLKYNDYRQIVFDLTDCLNKVNVNIDPYSLIELTLLEFVDHTEQNKSKCIIDEKKETIEDNTKELIEIRINNCFVDATKEAKKEAIAKWTAFVDAVEEKKLKPIIIDGIVALASETINVIILSTHLVDEFNELADEVSTKYKKITNKNVKFVALDQTKWEKVSKQYIKDIKNGKKYEYIKEPEKRNNNIIEKIATNLFDSDKIELQ